MVPWEPAIVLIAFAAIHVAEETRADFTRFVNLTWFDGNEVCPISRFKSIVLDKIALFSGLSLFAILGATVDARFILVSLGTFAADLVQHGAFSIAVRGYTPGVLTAVFIPVFYVYFFMQPGMPALLNDPLAWAALAGGAAFIAGSYLHAWWRVRRGHCLPAGDYDYR